jgi:hypothetical protein
MPDSVRNVDEIYHDFPETTLSTSPNNSYLFNFKMEKNEVLNYGMGAIPLYEEVDYYDRPNYRPRVRSYFVDLIDSDPDKEG